MSKRVTIKRLEADLENARANAWRAMLEYGDREGAMRGSLLVLEAAGVEAERELLEARAHLEECKRRRAIDRETLAALGLWERFSAVRFGSGE